MSVRIQGPRPPQPEAAEFLIMGQSYTLSCLPQEQARLAVAVSQVDAQMRQIRSGGLLDRERVAVLAALRLAFDASAPAEAEAEAEAQTQLAAEAAPPEGGPGRLDEPDSQAQEEQTQQERALHQLLQRLNAALQEDAPPSAHANRLQGK